MADEASAFCHGASAQITAAKSLADFKGQCIIKLHCSDAPCLCTTPLALLVDGVGGGGGGVEVWRGGGVAAVCRRRETQTR